MTCTDSAWPVVPEDTCSYVGFLAVPPANPDVVDRTPGTVSNGASMHQKHPPANTARALEDAAAGRSWGGAVVAADARASAARRAVFVMVSGFRRGENPPAKHNARRAD